MIVGFAELLMLVIWIACGAIGVASVFRRNYGIGKMSLVVPTIATLLYTVLYVISSFMSVWKFLALAAVISFSCFLIYFGIFRCDGDDWDIPPWEVLGGIILIFGTTIIWFLPI